MTIDITFDFRTDADGKDPDAASPTLGPAESLGDTCSIRKVT